MYSNDLILRWRRVFALLKDRRFAYYADAEMEQLLGCVDFDYSPALLKIETSVFPRQFRIELQTTDETLFFQADTTEDLKAWTAVINAHLLESHGCQEMLTFSHLPRPTVIAFHQMQATVDTGDILLFRSKTFLSKMQRTLTGS